jgi:hypothetical protein
MTMKLHALALFIAATVLRRPQPVIDKANQQAEAAAQSWSAWGEKIGVRWVRPARESRRQRGRRAGRQGRRRIPPA